MAYQTMVPGGYMLRPRPRITPHIQFIPAPPTPLPTLSTRTEFKPDCFRPKCQRVDAISDKPSKRSRRSTSLQLPSDVENPEAELSGSEGDDSRENSPEASALAGPSRLIPKPSGEPGRPSSGGFNLEVILADEHQWSKSVIEQFLKLVKSKAQECLDVSKSFSKQSKNKIQEVCNKVQKDMPHLARYDDCWPVRSALKLTLKYRSEHSRRTQMKEVNEQLRSALPPS